MAIGSMLKDTIYHAALSNVDEDGQFTYGTATAIAAKVQNKDEEVAMGGAQENNYKAQIITLSAVNRGDRIWLPGDSSSDANLAHQPSSIESATGLGSGETVYKVTL